MAAYTADWRKVNVIVHNILKLFTTKFTFYFTTIELASIEVATVCVVRNLESIQTETMLPVHCQSTK